MNIFSKQFLYSKKDEGTYKAYLLVDTTPIDVTTLGIVEVIDPKTTFGSSDDCERCDCVVINGKLYYYNNSTLTQVGTSNKWSAICGYTYTPSKFSFGICDSQLYKINNGTSTLFDNSSTWEKISYGRGNYCYGIYNDNNNLKLAGFTNTTITKNLGNISGWTDIKGCSYNSGGGTNYYAYGICNGTLYKLFEQQATSLSLNVTKISGYSSSNNSYFGLAIDTNGKLFKLSDTTTTQLGLDTTWTDISGEAIYLGATGINNGYLYVISGYDNTLTQIGSLSSWTKVSGGAQGGYAINNGDLYYIYYRNNPTPSKILTNCVNIWGQGSVGLALCKE